MNLIIADLQDITRAGLLYIIHSMENVEHTLVSDKVGLIEKLKSNKNGSVIVDYNLFDINDSDELLILCERFPESHWVLFCEDLTVDFIRRVASSTTQISILLKESSLNEIIDCVVAALSHKRFICQRVSEMLIAAPTQDTEKVRLTKTEMEIVKDIALGLTTKEISEKRFSSFHTVNTHRKNIFRKLQVNNVHEVTKYALRAGWVDSADYFI